MRHSISPVIADELRISPVADVECVLTKRCRTVAALARRVLRVSASARRVAAAYGSASQCFREARTHGSLLVFVDGSCLKQDGFLHQRILCTTDWHH